MKHRLLLLTLHFLITAFAIAQHDDNTPRMFRHSITTSSAEDYKPVGDIKWKFRTDGKIFSSPAVYKGLVFIGSEDGHLYAVDESTGVERWKFKTAGAVHSSPFVAGNSVYFGSMDGHFYAVDRATGKEKWKLKTGGEKVMGDTSYWDMKPKGMYMEDLWDCFLSSPIAVTNSDGNTVLFGSSDGYLYSVDASKGFIKWKFKTNGSIHSSPTLHNGTVYVGSWDGCMYAINARTGALHWKYQTGQQMGMTGIQASPAVYDGVVYFGARDAHLYALNASNGVMTWKYDAKNAWIVSSPLIHDGMVYTGTSDSYLFVGLDAKTGRERFHFKTNGYVFSTPAVSGSTAYIGDFTGRLFAIDVASGEKRFNYFSTESRQRKAMLVLNQDTLDFGYTAKGADLLFYETNKKVMDDYYSLGSIVSSPVVKDDVIYFGSADGNLYALKLKNQQAQK